MKKNCKICEIEKFISDFYAHSKMSDGHLNVCKECVKKRTKKRHSFLKKNDLVWAKKEAARHREKSKKARENGTASKTKNKTKSDWDKRNRDKKRAHGKVAQAKPKGILKPKPCEKCGEINNIQAHHEDYSKPLEVIWLCPACHGKEHRKL